MPQIKIQDVGIAFSETLFRNLSFSFGKGDRIGVVGNNGAGKTSLLRCVAGLAEPSEGTVSRPRGQRLEYVEQAPPPALMSLTLHEVVLSGLHPDESNSQSWRAEVVLDALAAPQEFRNRQIAELSGGWQRLAMIARAWISDPDALVIDEPTNHLDLTKILQLECWLNEEIGDTPLLVVSHDRRFLDRCTNKTLFLRPGESRLYAHPFSRARTILLEDDRALENRKGRELMELQRLRKSAHNLRQIGVDNYSAAALRKSIQIAKRADAIQDALTETHVELRRDVKLASRETHLKRIMGIKNLTVCRPNGEPLFRIGQLNLLNGDRAVVLGRNGTGKTQLVRQIRSAFANPEPAREAGIEIGPSLVLGYIDQTMSQLPDAETARDYISGILSTGIQRAASTLVAAGFPVGQHGVRIGAFSPGERARLALLTIRLLAPSFYLMDEPTNHLDISGQEQLEAEIIEHEATAILVSHDRTFVEQTGTRFLVVEDGSVIEVDSPEVFYEALDRDLPVSRVVKDPQIL
jgi:ATPase subunit of ABC transporter with duplicated ATPase domains